MSDPRSIREVLDRAIEQDPNKVYLLFQDKELTYSEIDRYSNQTANMFLEMGLKKGDRVALMMPNCVEYFYLWFGLVKIGASMVPVNTFFKEKEVGYILKHSEAKIVVGTPEYWPILKTAIALQNLQPQNCISVGGHFPNTTSYENTFIQCKRELPYFDIGLKDEAAILYTSGTTGNPKGCIENHEYYLLAGNRYSKHLELTAEDRVLTPLPLFHMNPQILSTMGTLFVGGSLALVDRFHPRNWWQELREKKPTFFHYLGVMPAMLMGLPPQEDEADHPLWIGVGAGMPPTIHKAFEERFNVVLLEVFGMTETGLNFCCSVNDDRKVGTACFYKPFAEYEAQVVDDDDREVPPDIVGELVLRGSDPQDRKKGFMKEYYKDPEATEKAWQSGWFHTGDYVKKDSDDFYYFVDRKKDIVRRSGENISASEVEAAIRLHDAIMDVAVIPVSDHIREQEVKAYLILKEGYSRETVPVTELIKWSEDHLAYFKIPRYWEYRDSFPVTQTGKIQKQILKKEKPDLTKDCFDRVQKKWL